MVKSTLPGFVQFLPMTMSFSGKTSFTILPRWCNTRISPGCKFATDWGLSLAYTLDASKEGVLEQTPQAPMYVAA
jgi:hypothetical protein